MMTDRPCGHRYAERLFTAWKENVEKRLAEHVELGEQIGELVSTSTDESELDQFFQWLGGLMFQGDALLVENELAQIAVDSLPRMALGVAIRRANNWARRALD